MKKSTYTDTLKRSAYQAGNILCMGLDPILEYLPPEFQGRPNEDESCIGLGQFFYSLFTAMRDQDLQPAAFKPNIGYYHAMDRPREGKYKGSRSLAALLDILQDFFPEVPVILDAKRGDIARSSLNYANEAFLRWECDAVTVSPYMGSDSVSPFFQEGKGVYLLNRTSNPGGADLQNGICEGKPLFERVAETVSRWHQEHEGVGAVVGATNPKELAQLARIYADERVPLLIPGVGSQGGSGSETIKILQEAGYETALARINSSSGLTHPWKGKGAPENWLEVLIESFSTLADEIRLER